jgi:hypothetical protein
MKKRVSQVNLANYSGKNVSFVTDVFMCHSLICAKVSSETGKGVTLSPSFSLWKVDYYKNFFRHLSLSQTRGKIALFGGLPPTPFFLHGNMVLRWLIFWVDDYAALRR